MLIKSMFLFAMSALAFTIPEGQPEGTYAVKRNAEGKEIHTLIQARADWANDMSPSEALADSAKFRLKRDPGLVGINEVTCNGVAFPKTPADAAYNALKALCPNSGSFWDGGNTVYASVDGGVAYWCNIDPWGRNGCYGTEVVDAIARVSKLCGGYQTGWVMNAIRHVVIGYGTVENSFCTAELLLAMSG